MTNTQEPKKFPKSCIINLPVEGWLKKSGGSKKGLKRRYFKLKEDNIIYYYKSERTNDPCGTINLGEAQAIKEDEIIKLAIHIHTKYRVYDIVAGCEEDKYKWLDAIERAIFSGKIFKLENNQSVSKKTKKGSTTKTGFMTKRGGSFKSWKKRWFILSGSILMYYKTKNDKKPLGEIALQGIEIKMLNGAKSSFVIDHTDRRSYFLRCSDDKERKDWVDTIHEVMTDFKGTNQKNLHLEYDAKKVYLVRKMSSFKLKKLKNLISKWKPVKLDYSGFLDHLNQITRTSKETSYLLFYSLDTKKEGMPFKDFIIAMIILSKSEVLDKINTLFDYLSHKESNILCLKQVYKIFIIASIVLGSWKLKHLTFLYKLKIGLNISEEIEDINLKEHFITTSQFLQIVQSELQFLEMFLIWNLKK
ncbi:sesquipedalian [Anaeramoeba flamelloides]|uniref:Sesquipedalian n=1 Tax=Anaeramoeba flamelloides TaxID=1746091 RepID=A0AAV7ZM37_9EUKA|nr:sesquipedalian [Anaeramoeba flamelloides]